VNTNQTPNPIEQTFRANLRETYNITEEQLTQLLYQQQPTLTTTFPLSILRTSELSSLEALVKYLRENKKQSYDEIGRLLNRNPRTLTNTYHNARRKKPQTFATQTEFETQRLSYTIFQQPLSILESVAYHLHTQHFTNAQIARTLNLNQRTIWTLLKRASQKLHGVDT